MEIFLKELVEQYLKTSSKLKKFDRMVFKRFAPNVSEVHDEFSRLAIKFERAEIYQYAAMCYLGMAKCEKSAGNTVSECHAYLRAARAFLTATNNIEELQLRSNLKQYNEGALRCYNLALDRTVDDTVLKAAIIREMTPLQPHYDHTSSFSSPSHRIYELELAAHANIQRNDFLNALHQLDDIVDNIYERKQQDLYEELLERIEILRVLLLVALNLTPARQSPSHIKLIEFYYQLSCPETDDAFGSRHSISGYMAGTYISDIMKFALGDIVYYWFNCDPNVKIVLEQFIVDFKTLNAAHCHVVRHICEHLDA